MSKIIYFSKFRLCKNVLQKVPLAFILNKADLLDDESLRMLKKTIVRQNFPNCIGIFRTFVKDGKAIDEIEVDVSEYVSEFSFTSLISIFRCPICKSDGIIVSRKWHTYTCEDCHATGTLPRKSNQMKRVRIFSPPDFLSVDP